MSVLKLNTRFGEIKVAELLDKDQELQINLSDGNIYFLNKEHIVALAIHLLVICDKNDMVKELYRHQ